VRALLEVAVQECSWDQSEAGHMQAELGDEVRWIRWIGSRS
jgi:hypothetical protein